MTTAKLFINGRSQAVRLPKEFRFEGDEVGIKRVGSAVLLFPILRTGRHISRREGTLLLVLYAGYLSWTLAAA